MEAQKLKSQLSAELLDKEGVSGVGIGADEDGNEVVVVNVESGKASSLSIPQKYEGENIEIRETGSFNAEIVRSEDPQNVKRKGRNRPVPGGVSAAHTAVTAGTTGFIMEDDNGNRYSSSNNHVYANVNAASEGDTIIQPGPADGGSTSDKSGTLAGYIKLENGVTVDFAWMNKDVEHTTELAGVGVPKGDIVEASIGDTLIKSGRTTGVTTGDVQQINADVNVSYGGTTYKITDCIITADMSDGGDSGSAVLKENTMEPVSVLFAGSNTATVHCKAANIEKESGLTIVTGKSNTTPTARVELTLTKENTGEKTGRIEAKAVDGSGSGVSGASVSISGKASDEKVTDSNGVVVFSEVTLGDYTVSALKSGYTGDSTTITAEDFN